MSVDQQHHWPAGAWDEAWGKPVPDMPPIRPCPICGGDTRMTARRKWEIAVECVLFIAAVLILVAGQGYEPWSGFVGMAGGTALGRLICHAPAIFDALGHPRA